MTRQPNHTLAGSRPGLRYYVQYPSGSGPEGRLHWGVIVPRFGEERRFSMGGTHYEARDPRVQNSAPGPPSTFPTMWRWLWSM